MRAAGVRASLAPQQVKHVNMRTSLLRSLLGLSLLIALGLAGCTTPAELGEPCVDSADCAAGLSCIVLMHEDARVCMPDCDLTTTRLCDDGAVCTPVASVGRPAELGVCYLGGTTAVGSPCTAPLACVRGALCVVAGDQQVCRRACRTDGSECDASEVCTPLENMGTNGFCEPAP